MTFLVVIAVVSLFVLAGVLVYAYMHPVAEVEVIPEGVGDIAILTYRELGVNIERAWHSVLPHVHHVTARGLSRYLAFRDRMYMRVFGQAAVPRGGATSYFLKRVIAHKEDFRRMKEERSSLHDAAPKDSGRDIFSRLKN